MFRPTKPRQRRCDECLPSTLVAPPPDVEFTSALIYDRDARGLWGEHARTVVVLRRRQYTLRDHTEHEVRVEGESEPRWIHAERLQSTAPGAED